MIPSIVRRLRRIALLALAGVAACTDEGTTPTDLRFGQIGRVTIDVSTPRRGVGELRQILTWSSEGPWQSAERISYRGKLGDETVAESRGDPVVLARAYATLIGLLNDESPVKLFLGDLLSPNLPTTCTDSTSVTVRIVDTVREDSTAWRRCGLGSLENLSGAGPDFNASRVIQAATLVRDFTVGAGFNSAYTGSLPFATIDRGEQSKAPLSVSRVIEDQSSWATFWAQHTGGATQVPAVDFANELVLVAALGTKPEAGDSVEVRRVVPVTGNTQIELWERRPGNFCTPAPRSHAPYHIVLAPRGPDVPLPIVFNVVGVDQIPCG